MSLNCLINELYAILQVLAVLLNSMIQLKLYRILEDNNLHLLQTGYFLIYLKLVVNRQLTSKQ